jgi:HNH endonuclease
MPRGAKRDLAVTKLLRRNYLFNDRRSFVSLGPEPKLFLYGVDMSAQRDIVYKNSRGRCRKCKVELPEGILEMDHVVSRGKGGDDSITNLQMLCPTCHMHKHNRVPKFGPAHAIRDFEGNR